jgi:hypothetical protein
MNPQPSRTMSSILAALALFATPASAAQDHLVPLDVMQSRLQESAERRQADVALVDRALATPLARAAAASLGRDVGSLRTAVYMLDDNELHDLAQRAAILQIDPAAGMRKGLKVTFIVVGSAVLLVLFLYVTLPPGM